jgi:hypothetical protein
MAPSFTKLRQKWLHERRRETLTTTVYDVDESQERKWQPRHIDTSPRETAFSSTQSVKTFHMVGLCFQNVERCLVQMSDEVNYTIMVENAEETLCQNNWKRESLYSF